MAALTSTPHYVARTSAALQRSLRFPHVRLVAGSVEGCLSAGVPGVLAYDADVVWSSGHSFWYEDGSPGILNSSVADLPPITASVLLADVCYSASFAEELARARPAELPPISVLTCDGIAPYTHTVLFPPLLEHLVAEGRPKDWHERLTYALRTTLGSTELHGHARRDWARWQVHRVSGRA